MNRLVQHIRLQHDRMLHFLEPLDRLDTLFVLFEVSLLLLVRFD